MHRKFGILVVLFVCLAGISLALVGQVWDNPELLAAFGIFDEPEIQFVSGVPLLPNVKPVVVLSGSDYEMGYQYMQQLNQIFGTWILQEFRRPLTMEDRKALQAYQLFAEEFTPEFVEFWKGIAAGATDAGVPLTYEEAMSHWTSGDEVFGKYAIVGAELWPSEAANEQLPPESDNCSSFAAWGSATKDGKLIASGSADGNAYYDVVLVVFPDEGNSFIWNIYEAVGTHLSVGGQPAMNDKGLVYVHHGCTFNADKMGRSDRYGVQSGMAIMHTLRFADNAKEAVDLHLSYDATGYGWYGTGGFWADEEGNAFVVERMEEPIVIREPGYLGEVDFMYSTNTPLHEDMGLDGQYYIPHAGWQSEGLAPNTSITRNLELWNMLNDYHGEVDLEFAKMLWRFRGAPVPIESTPDKWDEEAKAHYNDNIGAGWGAMIGRESTDHIGIIIAEDRLFYVIDGTSAYDTNHGSPTSMHGERYQPFATRTFFQLKLADSPAGVAAAAKYQAEINLFFANMELRKLDYHDPAYAPLDEIYNQALIEWTIGDRCVGQPFGMPIGLVKLAPEDQAIYYYARGIRAFTRCQALARKVYNALVPPAMTPEDLGLAPYEHRTDGYE